MGVFTVLSALIGLVAAQETGNHPEWPRWCGKAYQPQYGLHPPANWSSIGLTAFRRYPSFEPGGETVEPAALPNGPALDIQFKPRYSIYLESEKQAEFVVNAGISKWHGQTWPNLSTPDTAPQVVFTINLVSNNDVLISNRVNVSTTGNVYAFNLTSLKPRFDPYKVVLFGATENGASNVSATSELMFLPEKKTGSVAKLDNLNGGFLFRSPATKNKFEPFLPYGYYASCDNFLCDKDYVKKVKAYKDLGLNSMVSLTTVQKSRATYEYMDTLDLRYMYDLRGSYKNLTAVKEQVSVIRDFEGIYSYWGADEPDGHQDPFDLLPKARDLIRQLDPYHPVSVTLNCQNFYFKEYTAGADFVMEDVYPIGINSTFNKWGTPCNRTYGDCGCDNCQGNVQDVSNRLDNLIQYERWLGLWPKTKAHNPQTFHGENYWFRDPTNEEEVAMNALGFNHDAKVIASWVWPFSEALGVIMGKFGSTVANQPVRDFIVTGKAQRVKVKSHEVVDAAYWVGESQVLVSVVNGGYEAIQGEISIPLPKSITLKSKDAVVWGNGTWTLGEGEIRLSKQSGMATNMVILGVGKGKCKK
ncbi:glycoside hydrolase subgroup catalytic core protein [Pochonia chlamydosporia 170]|uniref:Glycoside hydrolase subgroup catalytic core protein n=1 Tax=Pochonia chlamydosporia 170 TaxID=1380566 RepID=A0A179FGG9_METCM|nr:glycoside hydrolase subgroup catalytic core protein [Pochonia chlamydosporia 170]OAQ64634.1 glycoside hydrolase subgroup catalytic core protein [Pochonia chlamydosporia 170]